MADAPPDKSEDLLREAGVRAKRLVDELHRAVGDLVAPRRRITGDQRVAGRAAVLSLSHALQQLVDDADRRRGPTTKPDQASP
jgi:hypothetical protein